MAYKSGWMGNGGAADELKLDYWHTLHSLWLLGAKVTLVNLVSRLFRSSEDRSWSHSLIIVP